MITVTETNGRSLVMPDGLLLQPCWTSGPGAEAESRRTLICLAYCLTMTSNMLVRLRHSWAADLCQRSRTSGVIFRVVVDVFVLGRGMVQGES